VYPLGTWFVSGIRVWIPCIKETMIIIIIIETTEKWYTHMPKPVYEEGDVTVLWNQTVHTD
jgi:hypothetical protein